MLDIVNKVITNPVVKKVGKIAYSKAPVAMLVTGVGCIIGGTILVATKSSRASEIINETRVVDEGIDNFVENGVIEDVKTEKRNNHISCLKDLAITYAVPASLVLSGIGFVIGAHHIQHSRLVALGAAYNTLLTGFAQYRERVISDQGFEKDQLYFGSEEHEIERVSKNKNGKETKRRSSINCPGSGDSESLYHRCFDEYNTSQWKRDPGYNLAFLLAQERIFNNTLHARGFVFLDEIYKELGFDLREYSNAKMVGWIDNSTGDSFIDFGIFNPTQPENISFVDGYEPAIWLNFNCDGVIIDKL